MLIALSPEACLGVEHTKSNYHVLTPIYVHTVAENVVDIARTARRNCNSRLAECNLSMTIEVVYLVNSYHCQG